MIKVTLTSVTGSTHTITLESIATVKDYIEQLKEKLPSGVSLKVDAPIAGVSGWVRSKQ